MTQAETLEEPEPPSRYVERYQLSGDPRLEFWRQTYLTVMPALIAQLGPAAADSGQLGLICRGAMAIADLSCALHLQRCDRERLDLTVENAIAWLRQFDGVPK